jgi:hypothetical protein
MVRKRSTGGRVGVDGVTIIRATPIMNSPDEPQQVDHVLLGVRHLDDQTSPGILEPTSRYNVIAFISRRAPGLLVGL